MRTIDSFISLMARVGCKTLLIHNLGQRRMDYHWTKANMRLIIPFAVQWVLIRFSSVMHTLGCLLHGWYYYNASNQWILMYYYRGSRVVALRNDCNSVTLALKKYEIKITRFISFSFDFSLISRPWVIQNDTEIPDNILMKYNGYIINKTIKFGVEDRDSIWVILHKVLKVMKEMQIIS